MNETERVKPGGKNQMKDSAVLQGSYVQLDLVKNCNCNCSKVLLGLAL